MAKDNRSIMAFDGFTQLIIKADALGRPQRLIKERPAPPAPIMSHRDAAADVKPAPEVKPTSRK
jgi:hypothetical protein